LNLLNSDSDFSCFFTDEDIVYKPFDAESVSNSINADEDVFCFSLRLGKNTNFCYTMNTPNVFRDYTESEGAISWDWSVHYLDFGYPLSIDGHIFKTKDILKLTKKVGFTNSNTFEDALQIFESFPKNKMASFPESVLVNTPNNIVNTNGLTHKSDVKELNKNYLNGSVIDLESMDFSNIIGCHQEIEFKYK
jgi:hypothetical protein